MPVPRPHAGSGDRVCPTGTAAQVARAEAEGPPRDIGRGRVPEPLRQQFRGCRLAQRGEVLGNRTAVVDEAHDGVAGVAGPWPEAADDADRQRRDPAADESGQGERVRVRPVQVLQGEQDRGAAAPLQPAQHAEETGRPFVHGGRCRPARGEQFRPAHPAECLDQEAERERRLHRVPAANPHADVHAGRRTAGVGEHRRFSQARLAEHEQGAAAAGGEAVQQPPHRAEDAVPLKQPAPGSHRPPLQRGRHRRLRPASRRGRRRWNGGQNALPHPQKLRCAGHSQKGQKSQYPHDQGTSVN